MVCASLSAWSRFLAAKESMATFRLGDFEWDDAKAVINEHRHGVTFVEAMTRFLDAQAFTPPDKDDPDRFILIGLSSRFRVLFVVSAEAGDRIRMSRAGAVA